MESLVVADTRNSGRYERLRHRSDALTLDPTNRQDQEFGKSWFLEFKAEQLQNAKKRGLGIIHHAMDYAITRAASNRANAKVLLVRNKWSCDLHRYFVVLLGL